MSYRNSWCGLVWVAVLQLAIASSSMQGAEVTYDVDLGGTAFSGHELRVIGTITADTTTDLMTTSNLTFLHEEDQVSLPALPTLFGSDAGYEWDATPTSLVFFRTARSPGQHSELTWQSSGEDARSTFVLGSVDAPHFLLYESSPAGDMDQFIILDAVAPDPRGYLVGAAVPEPSMSILAAFALLGVAFSRWRPKA